VTPKFFEFLVDKEVVRTLKVEIVVQIRRLGDDEDPGDASEEGDLAGTADAALERLVTEDTTQLDALMASLEPDPEELQRLMASLEPNAEELGALMKGLDAPS
jgi:hypothetical protein